MSKYFLECIPIFVTSTFIEAQGEEESSGNDDGEPKQESDRKDFKDFCNNALYTTEERVMETKRGF